jgi:iron(III) transport system ATP-binding protein
MRSELKDLQRRTGITFVYVTHDQAEALALSDQIAVMNHGRVQQYGTPFEVYARPANRMVADFMGLVNLVPGKVRERRGTGGTVEIAPELAVTVDTLDGFAAGDAVEVAIRPESVRLIAGAASGGTPATVSNHVFLGNISEYYATLPSGLTLRVQTHPLQQLKVGEPCAVEVDASHCSVFRASSSEAKAA